jgi:hypothetical protein
VSCVGGTCTGGGASSGGGDGGYTVVIQGPGGDGGLAWGVTGTVTAVGPVTDTQLRATPVPVSGTLTCSGPLTDTQLRATAVPVSLTSTTVTGSVTVTGPVTDTQIRATPLPVSGTLTCSGPLTDTQLRASAVPVSLAANQSVNLNQVAGAGIATGNGTAAGSVRVSLASDTTGIVAQSGTWTVQPGNTANTTPWLATARIVGNTGAVVDAANNAAAPANVLAVGYEAQSSALGASATASNVRRPIVGLDGVTYVREGGPLLFSGGVTAIGATLTQVVAAPAAGTSLYLTDVMVMSDTATAGTFVIRTGTASNCATGTASLYPSAVTTAKSMYPGNAAAPLVLNFHTPMKVAAASALCILCVATNTCTAQFWGYTAP